MGILPDPYPVSQPGNLHVGITKFDRSTSDALRAAEIRGHPGADIHALSVMVVPPPGVPMPPIAGIRIGRVNGVEPQIVVEIAGPRGAPIADHFSFASALAL